MDPNPLVRAYIGLGSNLGERAAYLDGAIAALSAHPGVQVVAVSRYIETDPVDVPDPQPRYLNAVAGLDTTLDPFALHRLLTDIEARFGRIRTHRNAARTLDLDLLLYGNQTINTPELTIPHPRMHERAFVLEPLAEIAPELFPARLKDSPP